MHLTPASPRRLAPTRVRAWSKTPSYSACTLLSLFVFSGVSALTDSSRWPGPTRDMDRGVECGLDCHRCDILLADMPRLASLCRHLKLSRALSGEPSEGSFWPCASISSPMDKASAKAGSNSSCTVSAALANKRHMGVCVNVRLFASLDNVFLEFLCERK